MSNFVSEAELEQIRKRRQEEWEKIRRPDQPLEAPEEEYDPRSLYERLQANKMKAQEELEESRRLKNLIRGLDDEEVSFLETVDKLKMDEETQRLREDRDALAEYKRAVNNLTEEEQSRKIEEFKKSLYSNFERTGAKKVSNPLAGLIRPKTAEKPDDQKEAPTSSTKTGLVDYGSDSDSSDDDSDREKFRKKPKLDDNQKD